VQAVEPARLLSSARPQLSRLDALGPTAPIFLIAAGKAAWPMARAFLDVAPSVPRRALVACPSAGDAPPSSPVEWFEASHPFPNQASVDGAERALAIARESRSAGGTLLVLLSGGASSMLTAPCAGIALGDKIAVARRLMHAGMAIGELNCVRKHLSRIKGGQLAAAAGRSITLAISDVHAPVADDPSVIGSGPTVADPTTFAEALAIVEGVDGVPESVRGYLERGAAGVEPETVKPGDPRLTDTSYVILGNRLTALAGARQAAESAGYRVVVIDDVTSGEARDAAVRFVSRASAIAARSSDPVCVLAAGETTVTVTGRGLGGRNQEFALAAAPSVQALDGDVVLASVGTDGADGPTDAAGAVIDRTTLERSARLGLDWAALLADNDAYRFFAPLGDLVRWGPTGTNVGDVQLFLRA
jgi:glycerate 2-kinase